MGKRLKAAKTRMLHRAIVRTHPMRRRSGFTIVELLIVIVVIGILAAISIAAYNGIQERARVNSAKSDMAMLQKAIMMARINRATPLISITNSNCTRCFDQTVYETTLDRIGSAAGMNLSGLKKGDPWGNKYWLDENEMESGSCAMRDSLSISPSRPEIPTIQIPFYSC